MKKQENMKMFCNVRKFSDSLEVKLYMNTFLKSSNTLTG